MGKDYITLKNAPTGVNFTIDHILGENCKKIREFGFCEGLCICKLKNNRNIMCDVCGTKYVISQELSKDIQLSENQSPDHDQPSSEE